MKDLLHEFVAQAITFIATLVPSALGSIVSMLYDLPTSWTKRFTQLWVGIVVSYFVQRAAGAIYPFHPFVLQALSFWLGMVAFKAAPAIITGTASAAAEAPGMIRDRLLAFLPSKKEKP